VCVEQREQFSEVWLNFHTIVFASSLRLPLVPPAVCSTSRLSHAV
jgi:hypothetical protein